MRSHREWKTLLHMDSIESADVCSFSTHSITKNTYTHPQLVPLWNSRSNFYVCLPHYATISLSSLKSAVKLSQMVHEFNEYESNKTISKDEHNRCEERRNHRNWNQCYIKKESSYSMFSRAIRCLKILDSIKSMMWGVWSAEFRMIWITNALIRNVFNVICSPVWSLENYFRWVIGWDQQA